MNVQHNRSSNIPWMKIGLIVGVIVLVGVFSGRAGIEKIFGLEPGTLGGTAVAEKDNDKESSPNFDIDTDWKKDSSKNDDARNSPNSQSKPDSVFELKRDGFVMKSPAGLTYYVGDRGENRIEHVMRHAKDDPNRPSHGVFVGSENEILETIDKAYTLIKANSRQVIDEEKDGSRMAYEIDMKRKIGYKGGKSGKRDGNPDLKIMKLILDKGTRVITAYPYR